MAPRTYSVGSIVRRALVGGRRVAFGGILCALAMALGASRPEAGTIRALHAVLIQLAWPGTSNMEACTFTNASMSNFARWRRRVVKAETAPVCAQAAEMV